MMSCIWGREEDKEREMRVRKEISMRKHNIIYHITFWVSEKRFLKILVEWVSYVQCSCFPRSSPLYISSHIMCECFHWTARKINIITLERLWTDNQTEALSNNQF